MITFSLLTLGQQDYIGITRQPLTLTPTMPSVTVNVITLNDSKAERDETFRCLLQLPQISDEDDNIPLTISQRVATITIEDLNPGTCTHYILLILMSHT